MSGLGSNGHPVDSDGLIYVSPLNNEKFVIPDAPRKCLWSRNAGVEGMVSPHSFKDWKRNAKIQQNVLELIGNTPMVKLNSIPKKAGIKCNVYAKCEYFNPGGSVKDRVANRMIEDGEAQGLLKPGMTIIEPSSGNTGIGVALASAVKGYKCIIVMSEKMSNEKISVINALGAKLIKTPITADSYAADGIFGVAHRLHREIPNSFILDQFSNPGNPLSHYDTTAEEIMDQCDHKVDMLVLGAGTGGTVTGIARKFKEASPNTQIVGVDPVGSVFAVPESLNETEVTFFEVEGLGYDFVPTTLDQNVVDHWIKTEDQESLTMARRLIREEGLLCGTSSGAAVCAAVKMAQQLHEGQNLVVVLPDSIRNYITKFVSDVWMEARGFQPCINVNNHWWWDEKISKLRYPKVETLFLDEECGRVYEFMKSKRVNEIAILKRDGNMLGAISLKDLMNNLLTQNLQPTDKIEESTRRIYPKIDIDAHLGLASRILEKESYVIVTESEGIGRSKTETPVGVIHVCDLFDYVSVNTLSDN
ncbi:cystathionine beta-synthase-like [Cylas formicarius]|uniref:cystathionine beta-synthase-like n=1 Tax=Cylas formicarius TaxID=197179 RepID=UPI002958D35F|nr:cystathionine beta-synthase-like [Cylas formicarius]XP_060520440.1 cystathionine beta-synthase-like [Cylas formicarius]